MVEEMYERQMGLSANCRAATEVRLCWNLWQLGILDSTKWRFGKLLQPFFYFEQITFLSEEENYETLSNKYELKKYIKNKWTHVLNLKHTRVCNLEIDRSCRKIK